MKYKYLFSLILFFLIQNTLYAFITWDLETGVEEFRKNNLQYAKYYFLGYTKNVPNDIDGYYWLARAFCADKKTQTSEEFARINYKKSYELTTEEKNLQKVDFAYKAEGNIEDYFDMATMYFDDGNIKEAEYYADMMLKINPKSASAYFIKAKVAYYKKDEKKAKEYLTYAINFDNDLLDTNLAKSLDIIEAPILPKEDYLSFALEEYFKGNIDNAIKHLENSSENYPYDIDTLNMLSNFYIKKDEFQKAQKTINDVLKIDENLTALLNEAKIEKINNDDKLQDTLLRAYKINPNSQTLLLYLGDYYLSKENWAEANKYYENLININNSLYEAYSGLAYSYAQMGRIKEAVELIRKSYEINKDASISDYILALICKNQGGYEEAKEYLKEAVKKDKNPYYYLELAKVNYILYDYDNSVENLKVASFLDREGNLSDEINEYFIKNYLKLSEIDLAQNHINRVSINYKNRLLYKYNLYVLLKLQGLNENAQSQLEQIKKAKTSTFQDVLDRSEIAFELEGEGEAIKIIDKAFRKYPQNYKLYLQKIKIYSKSNNQDKVKETLNSMEAIFE